MNLESDSTVLVVRELKILMEVYKILTELTKSSTGELNLDVLAEKLLYKRYNHARTMHMDRRETNPVEGEHLE